MTSKIKGKLVICYFHTMWVKTYILLDINYYSKRLNSRSDLIRRAINSSPCVLDCICKNKLSQTYHQNNNLHSPSSDHDLKYTLMTREAVSERQSTPYCLLISSLSGETRNNIRQRGLLSPSFLSDEPDKLDIKNMVFLFIRNH